MEILCPFCKPYKFKLILEGNNFLIIEDSHPISLGHLLIITKRHVKSFFLTTDEEKVALFNGIEQAKALIEKGSQAPMDIILELMMVKRPAKLLIIYTYM